MNTKQLTILIIAVLAAAVGTILNKWGYNNNDVNPLSVSVSILFVTLLIFSAIMLVRREPIKLSPKIWKKLAFLGLIATTAGMGIRYVSLYYTTATNFAFLSRLQAPLAALFAFLIMGEKLTRRQLSAMILMFIGSYLIVFKLAALSFNIGDALVIIYSAILGYSLVYFKKELAHKVSLTQALFGRSLVGVPILILIMLYFLGGEIFGALMQIPHIIIPIAITYVIFVYGLYFGINIIAGFAIANFS